MMQAPVLILVEIGCVGGLKLTTAGVRVQAVMVDYRASGPDSFGGLPCIISVQDVLANGARVLAAAKAAGTDLEDG